VLLSTVVEANPLEYHIGPLQAETVERVIVSLDALINELERTGAIDSLRQDPNPDRRIPLWRIQAVIAEPTGGSLVDSPVIRRAALQAGYADGPFVVEEWQLDADRVLDVYEAGKRGTNAGDPLYNHEVDYEMVSGYLDELDALARRLQGQ
jgi:hypothetical protein